MSVRRAQREIDAHEFAEWMAYERLESFGPLRDDRRAGVIASTLANLYLRRGARPFEAADFFPSLAAPVAVAPEEWPSPEELEAKFMAWAARMQAASR